MKRGAHTCSTVFGLVGGVKGLVGSMGAEGRNPFFAVAGEALGEGSGVAEVAGVGVSGGLSYTNRTTHEP